MYIQFKKVIKDLPGFTLQKAQTIANWAQLYTILVHLGLVWIRKTNLMHPSPKGMTTVTSGMRINLEGER